MGHWSVQDAKARFSEFLNTCLDEGPQIVTRRGDETAVLVPIKEWEALRRSARPTLKELLLADEGRSEALTPKRCAWRQRFATTSTETVYLLDTNVVSEFRRPRPHGAVVVWLRSVAATDLHLSAVTIGELQAGVETTRGRDPDKATEIETWVDRIVDTYSVISADARVFRAWARLRVGISAALLQDALIAATAEVHGLTVVTRNIRDFEHFDVATLNPFEHQ